MKKAILSFSLVAAVLAACNNNNPKTSDQSLPSTDSLNTLKTELTQNLLLKNYLAIENGLVNDDGKTAADAGKTLVAAIKSYDASTLTASQQKVFNDIKSDAIENAEHISENATKIDHQREHFVLLSEDLYDFVKSVDTKTTLYKIFCPMANDKNGAFWLSTSKNIENPYMGQKMSTCGWVEETIN